MFAVIAAGGIGSRMGADMPKQYISIKGKPIIAHTVAKFTALTDFRQIIILCPQDWCDYTREILKEHCPDKRVTVIAGGESRNETVMKAIEHIEKHFGIDDGTVVVTHDAVRPFVTDKIIRDNLELSKSCEAIGTVIPATDTIIESLDGKTVTDVPDRSRLYQCQTPQTFRAKKLRELYMSLSENEKSVLTDCTGIFIRKGLPVHNVPGAAQNIKITYPYDLIVAKAILEE